MRKSFVFGAALLGLVVLLAACGSSPTPTPVIQEVIVTVEVPVEITRVVEVLVTVEPAVNIPFEELWAGSAHANASAEALSTGTPKPRLKCRRIAPSAIAPAASATS